MGKMRRKSRRRGIFLLAALLLLTSVFLSGCSQQAERTKVQYLVGVSMSDVSIRWLEILKSELEIYSSEMEDVRFIFRNASGDPAKQKDDISRLEDDGIDLLIVTPSDVEQMMPVISKVYEQIPVIIMNRGVEGFDYTEFIGPNNVLVGEQGAEQVEELIRYSDHKGILEIGESSYVSDERSRAFESHINQFGYYSNKVLLKQATRDFAEDRIMANPEYLSGVGVIFAHTDTIAQGVWRALQTLDRTDIAIVCVDDSGDEENLDLLAKGAYSALIECPTGGEQAVKAALAQLRENAQLPQKLILRSTPVTTEDVEQYRASMEEEKEPREPDDKIRMGYVQIKEDTAFRSANTASIVSAARRADIELTMAVPEPDLASQVAQARAFIREGMDVIAISPIVAEGWEDVLTEAKNAGIPVILCDRGVDAPIDLYSCFIGADYEEEGKKCGDWLLNELTGTGDVRVLQLLGTEGSSPARDRQAGFEKELSRDEHFTVCASLQGDFDRERGKEQTADYLKKYGSDIDAIYAHNDEMALGAVDALEEYGVVPGSDVLIMSVDGTKDALKALRSGKINAVAECSPLLGTTIMEEAENLVNGDRLAQEILIHEQFFTALTDEDMLSNRAY